jgi:hypothetical protein
VGVIAGAGWQPPAKLMVATTAKEQAEQALHQVPHTRIWVIVAPEATFGDPRPRS